MKDKPHYFGHRKRLRQRFNTTGAEGLPDYEILELLLSFAVPQRDVKPIAKILLKKFGSISAVLDAGIDELCEVKGIGERSATLIRVIKDFTYIYLADRMKNVDYIKSPDAVIDFARTRIAGIKNETFMIICVNSKNRVQGYEIVQEGTIDKAALFPRKVIESSIAHKANGIVLVHNHPSGDCEHSPEDKDLTKDIVNAGETLDIRVVDHLIVGTNGYFSFAESGLLK